ncbi:MAG: hypothetical protein ACLUVG_11300 [Phocaeicola vulgatus]
MKSNKQLSTLGITFSNNILNENNAFKLFVDKQEDLSRLARMVPPKRCRRSKSSRTTRQMAVYAAQRQPSPFLQYSANRPLREKIYKAYINRGNNNDKNDNKKIITQHRLSPSGKSKLIRLRLLCKLRTGRNDG